MWNSNCHQKAIVQWAWSEEPCLRAKKSLTWGENGSYETEKRPKKEIIGAKNDQLWIGIDCWHGGSLEKGKSNWQRDGQVLQREQKR